MGFSANSGSYSLGSSTDVALSSPANNEILTYDSSVGKWKNKAFSAGNVGTTRTPETYGAAADGTTDDQSAITAMLAAATAGDTIIFAAGKTYAHSGVITVSTANLTINGANATLYATTPATAALKFSSTANNCIVNGLRHTVNIGSATRDSKDLSMTPFVIDGASGITFNDVISEHSQASGMFIFGAQKYTINRPTIANSLSDGLHQTHGSAYGTVIEPTIFNSGDDGVAVVSYSNDGAQCHDINIVRPEISNPQARGISVVGGYNTSYYMPRVYRSTAAGVYVACETSYLTYGVSNVHVYGGTLEGCNTDAGIDHGAILVANSRFGYTIDNVEIKDVYVSDTRASASWNVGMLRDAGATVSNITINDITLAGAGPDTALNDQTTAITHNNWNYQTTPRRLVLSSDMPITQTSNLLPAGMLFSIDTPGTYQLSMIGAYQASATTVGPRFGIAGNQTSVGTTLGIVEQHLSATSRASLVLGWGGGAGSGSNPAAANTSLPFSVQATVTVVTTPAGGGGTAAVMFNASGGTVTLMAGTYTTLTRIS